MSNSGQHSNPVANRKPNPWGFYDMYGNVSEWCWDAMHSYPDGKGIDLDPVGKHTPDNGHFRMTRGGNWGSMPYACRTAFRASLSRTKQDSTSTGFRIALAPIIKN